MRRKFTFIDLCSGVGAFHEALSALGGRCALACDIDDTAKQTYMANHCHNTEAFSDDLYTINSLPDHDVLCAGFPCVAFSLAGNKLGTADPRGRIIYEIIRLLTLKKKKPSIVLFENVSGIRIVQNGRVLLYICEKLKSMGYNVFVQEYSAIDFGSPCARKRVMIFGTRGFELSGEPQIPRKDLNKNIEDILEPGKHVFLEPERYVVLPENKWSANDEGKVFVGFLKVPTYKYKDLSLISAHYQGGRIVHIRGKSETFTSVHTHAVYIPSTKKVRFLTPREMFSAMGFDRSFLIPETRTVAIRQVSNSINLFMLRPLCKWVIECSSL